MPAIILDQVVDFSPMIELQETPDTLIASLNLFDVQYHATTAIEIGRQKNADGLIPARERGGERNFLTMDAPSVKVFRIPFFPLDKNIKAQDIQSFRSFAMGGINDNLRTEAEVVNRYMTQILRDVAKTKEKIFAEAVMGRAYNGVGGAANSAYNWYTEWGASQKSVSVDFSSTTVSPAATIEQEARAYIIDQKQDGSTATRIVALCSREFFASLVNSPFVRQAYQYFQGTPNLLRDRLSGNMDVQVFEWNGVTYIEDIHGNIPAGEAFVLPMGIPDMFQAHYAPADTPELANTVARDLYTFMVSEHRTVQLQSEFSLLAVNTRPELVVKLTTA
ncbi:major head protein [Escherichia phage VEcB]|uniref:Major head protein n=1 Tax=Escherichia phage VEcB TaxID=2776821 RepID=A0A7L8ZGA8_9CAUD|nr:major head protein [Escherichia phage VEcB]QOI68059.1 major head protein [Escherichia phage VEcB]